MLIMDFLVDHNYVASESDELNLIIMDCVRNVSVLEEGWMVGDLDGKRGVFPSNYGKVIKADLDDFRDDSSNVQTSKDMITKVPPVKKVSGIGFGNISNGKQVQLKHSNDRETNDAFVKPMGPPPLRNKPSLPRPPSVERAKAIQEPSSNMSKDPDLEGLNLEVEVSHTPLTGLTVSRARRPKVRLPMNGKTVKAVTELPKADLLPNEIISKGALNKGSNSKPPPILAPKPKKSTATPPVPKKLDEADSNLIDFKATFNQIQFPPPTSDGPHQSNISMTKNSLDNYDNKKAPPAADMKPIDLSKKESSEDICDFNPRANEVPAMPTVEIEIKNWDSSNTVSLIKWKSTENFDIIDKHEPSDNLPKRSSVPFSAGDPTSKPDLQLDNHTFGTFFSQEDNLSSPKSCHQNIVKSRIIALESTEKSKDSLKDVLSTGRRQSLEGVFKVSEDIANPPSTKPQLLSPPPFPSKHNQNRNLHFKRLSAEPIVRSTQPESEDRNDLIRFEGISMDTLVPHQPIISPSATKSNCMKIWPPRLDSDSNFDLKETSKEESNIGFVSGKVNAISPLVKGSSKATLNGAQSSIEATYDYKDTKATTSLLSLDTEFVTKTGVEPQDPKFSPLQFSKEISTTKTLDFSNNLFEDKNDGKSFKESNGDNMKRTVEVLQAKINKLEEENSILKKELAEILLINNSFNIQLSNSVHKLLTYFDQPKTKES